MDIIINLSGIVQNGSLARVVVQAVIFLFFIFLSFYFISALQVIKILVQFIVFDINVLGSLTWRHG